MKTVSGFSKMSKEEKIDWLASELSDADGQLVSEMRMYWHQDNQIQKRFDEFSENTLTNFDLPFGIAPNFLINNKIYAIPMVIEESSVVAAASLSAKFWSERGGFKAKVLSTQKIGQVHFLWEGEPGTILELFKESKSELLDSIDHITQNMKLRGGGVIDFDLIDMTSKLKNYYQLKIIAETCDAMGANFINSILEEIGKNFANIVKEKLQSKQTPNEIEIIMCILSNYTPQCLVECYVDCPVNDLGVFAEGMSAENFARRFITAVNIAKIDPHRAVTHNKGIMNGIDAVVLATGNDFRAIEACAHAFASRDGDYRSLSDATIENGHFKFSIKLPLAIGTVGGLTVLHPLAKTSLAILGHPSAQELMQVMAAAGLAQNFGALKSLVTTGIQKGHMKLHLLNILNQLNSSSEQIESAKDYFKDKVVSYRAVRDFINGGN
jgi:hydroxymethylglutaryl-CoA reductase